MYFCETVKTKQLNRRKTIKYDMVIRKKRKIRKNKRISMRLTSRDKQMIAGIKKRTGVTNTSEAIRIALKNSVRR